MDLQYGGINSPDDLSGFFWGACGWPVLYEAATASRKILWIQVLPAVVTLGLIGLSLPH